MLNDTDIKKLSEVFITRADFKHEADFLKERISVLNGYTKENNARLYGLEDGMRGIKNEVTGLKGDVTKLKGFATRTAEMVSRHDTTLKEIQETMLTKDDFTKAIRTLGETVDKVAEGMDIVKSENIAIGLQLDRHELEIHGIARRL